jgi:hypothetical protein
MFEGCLWYCLEVICCTNDVFHCLKSSALRVILSSGNRKMLGGERSSEYGVCGRVGI